MIVTAKTREEALKLAEEKAKATAAELETKRGKEVLYFVFFVEEKEGQYDFADAYVEQPNRAAKMGAIDVIYSARPTVAGENLWLSCGIKDASDARFETDDNLFIGLVHSLFSYIQFAMPALKKLEDADKLYKQIVDSGLGQKTALIRYFFKEDPDQMDEETFIRRCYEVDVVAKALGMEVKK